MRLLSWLILVVFHVVTICLGVRILHTQHKICKQSSINCASTAEESHVNKMNHWLTKQADKLKE